MFDVGNLAGMNEQAKVHKFFLRLVVVFPMANLKMELTTVMEIRLDERMSINYVLGLWELLNSGK